MAGIINEHIWKAVKIPCAFVFKRAKVYLSVTSNYIEVRRHCEEGRCLLDINCDRESDINSANGAQLLHQKQAMTPCTLAAQSESRPDGCVCR